jgi:rhodanese-related sulfurtransferase
MMSKETQDTLGNQKKTNYALNPALTREEFIEALLNGLTPPPAYFPHNVLMNIGGYESIDSVLNKGMTPLSAEAFEAAQAETKAIVLDTRAPQEFAKGFIPGSYNIGIDGSFANWVGTIFKDVKQPLLLVVDEGREEEAVTRLARIGFDNAHGFLKGGMAAWQSAGKAVGTIQSISAQQFADHANELNILDVRRKSEYDSEHVVGAVNHPLDYWQDHLASLDKTKTWHVHCAGGYRSMIFASILRANGYTNLIDVAGGFSAIKATGKVNVTDYVCPSTLL